MFVNKIKTKNICLLFLGVLLSFNISASSLLSSGFNSPINLSETTSEPLLVDDAFSSEPDLLGDKVNIIFDIEPEHYIYKDKIKINIDGIEQNINFPKGQLIKDDFFGETEVFNYGFSVNIKTDTDYISNIKISYQGCSKSFNLCYPPVENNFYYTPKKIKEVKTEKIEPIKQKEKEEKSFTDEILFLSSTNNANDISEFIETHTTKADLFFIFLLIGIFLAFTPCIYPMLPMIVASTSNSKNKKVAISFYIIGMALSYSFIGIVSGLFNINIQLITQNEITLYIISAIILILAMFMLGFINIVLPTSINTKITEKISKLNPDSYFNQSAIGFLSSLMLSPCTMAPLLGILIFINQLNEPIFGALLLFFMGVGIGIPIFILATSLNRFMPKNGYWMVYVKNIIGIVMIFIALYLLKSKIDYLYIQILGVLVIMITSLKMLSLDTKKIISYILLIFSIIYLINITVKENISNNINNKSYKNSEISLKYKEVNNIDELNKVMLSSDKPIFIDYFAEWCITCVRMDNTVLKNESIIKKLNKEYFMIKIDLTEMSKDDKKIMEDKNIIAIPYYTFIDKENKEYIYTGEFNDKTFTEALLKHQK